MRDAKADSIIARMATSMYIAENAPNWVTTTVLTSCRRTRFGCSFGGIGASGGYRKDLERETRIELATNSLEGCDSTIELLPP